MEDLANENERLNVENGGLSRPQLLMERHGNTLMFPPLTPPPGRSPQWVHLLHEYPLSSASNLLHLIHHNIQI